MGQVIYKDAPKEDIDFSTYPVLYELIQGMVFYNNS